MEHPGRRKTAPFFKLFFNQHHSAVLILMALASTLSLTLTPAQATAGHVQEALFFRLTYMDDRAVNIQAGPMENNTLVGQGSQVRSPGHCAQLCLAEERCSSFFYDSGAHLCLMQSIVFLGNEESSPHPGMTYWQISQDHCPSQQGFILYRPLALCYKYYGQQVFWTDANATCNAAGTSLIKVSSQDISTHLYQFLRGSLATRSRHICIGVSRETGSYQWPDGSEVTWFNWAQNEPSGGEEKCVTMAWFYYFLWNDIPCASNPTAKYNFVCQKIL